MRLCSEGLGHSPEGVLGWGRAGGFPALWGVSLVISEWVLVCYTGPGGGGLMEGLGQGLLTAQQQLDVHIIHHLGHGLGVVADGVPCERRAWLAGG